MFAINNSFNNSFSFENNTENTTSLIDELGLSSYLSRINEGQDLHINSSNNFDSDYIIDLLLNDQDGLIELIESGEITEDLFLDGYTSFQKLFLLLFEGISGVYYDFGRLSADDLQPFKTLISFYGRLDIFNFENSIKQNDLEFITETKNVQIASLFFQSLTDYEMVNEILRHALETEDDLIISAFKNFITPDFLEDLENPDIEEFHPDPTRDWSGKEGYIIIHFDPLPGYKSCRQVSETKKRHEEWI